MKSKWLCLFLLGLICPAGSSAAAEKSDRLDWSAWRRMPVFIDGRIMPLDSFARDTVETICGRTRPTLSPVESGSEGKPRRREPYELLLSWLVEPERWEEVPFLAAEHEQLRRDLLGVPFVGPDGQRLKYVSPRQVERAGRLEARLRKIQQEQHRAQANFDDRELSGVDKKASELFQGYRLFRVMTFQPAGPLDPRGRSYALLVEGVEKWRGLEAPLGQLDSLPGLEESKPIVAGVGQQIKRLVDLAEAGDKFEPGRVEPILVELHAATGRLAAQYKKVVGRLFAEPDKVFPRSGPNAAEELRQVRAKLQELATGLADASGLFNSAQQALCDSGRSLRLVPALNAGALDSARDTADESQPWLSLQTLLSGSPVMMARYPQAELTAVRQAFAALKTAYVQRQRPDRPQAFAAAMKQFTLAVRNLGEKLEPARRALLIPNRDEAILNLTAYPPPGATEAEVHYNDVDPFFWSWVVNLLALAILSLAFGILRKPMFWLGVATLVAGQALTCYGFGLRTYVTGWAPVTGMFETVVFVALVAALIGLWFTLQPLFGTALGSAWRLTAVPGTWEAGPLGEEELAVLPAGVWRAGQWLSVLVRVALMAGVFYVLAWYPYASDGKSAIISLRARTDVGSLMPTLMDTITWLVGLSVLGVSVWYVPRAVLAVGPAIVLVPLALARLGIARPLRLVMERKAFALVGAATAFLVAAIAYYSPLWHKDIGTLMPVLRDRFWLYIHVLTITASYGAGILGLGLGDIALCYYLFGKYREPEDHSRELAAQGHRPAHELDQPHPGPRRLPPEACATLAGFNYKAMQVAVLLLAAGTILGGLWADVAWGRFWGWDAKEVWALISLLVYVAILHGRYAGWFGSFGLAAGSVAGASAIIMAWYGVNYFLRSGLHTYAQGAGGQMQLYVLGFFVAQWTLLVAAGVRYWLETSGRP